MRKPPSCPTGKVTFTSHALASAASKRSARRTEEPMNAYHCPQCGHFHVGTRNQAKRPLRTIEQPIHDPRYL